MKPVAELHVNLAGIIVMETAEREAIVDQQVAIGDIERSN